MGVGYKTGLSNYGDVILYVIVLGSFLGSSAQWWGGYFQ